MTSSQHPWTLSYSFGRALQTETMKIWNGKDENVKEAQAKLLSIAKACSEAGLGQFQGGDLSKDGTYVANYKY